MVCKSQFFFDLIELTTVCIAGILFALLFCLHPLTCWQCFFECNLGYHQTSVTRARCWLMFKLVSIRSFQSFSVMLLLSHWAHRIYWTLVPPSGVGLAASPCQTSSSSYQVQVPVSSSCQHPCGWKLAKDTRPHHADYE